MDAGAGPLIRFVTRLIPVLTYARIEFGANILLFVPLGVLLTLILRDRALVLPIAIVLTLVIESVQGVLLDRRTPSELDMVANTAGACIGLLGVAAWQWWRRGPACAWLTAAWLDAPTLGMPACDLLLRALVLQQKCTNPAAA